MRNPSSTGFRPRADERPGLGVTIASALVAYVLLVLTCAMTVERLIAATPPDIVAGIAQSAAAGWFPP